MNDGAFLKNKRIQEQRNSKQLTDEEPVAMKAKRLRAQRKCQRLWLGIGVLLALLIVTIVTVISLPSGPLEGKWEMDAVTSYEFYRDGKGAMILPSAEYDFSYAVKENTVYIDFLYDGAKDAQYNFAVDGNTLTLEGGNATTQDIYVLIKSE